MTVAHGGGHANLEVAGSVSVGVKHREAGLLRSKVDAVDLRVGQPSSHRFAYVAVTSANPGNYR